MSRPILLIVGGSRGIGAATARMAGARGYDVAVTYKSNAEAAESVCDAVRVAGGRAFAVQGDAAREDDIEQVFDETTRAARPHHSFRAQRRHRRQEFAARCGER